MKFRKLITAICLFVSISCMAQSNTTQETLFPYPQVPDELTTLQERTSYLVNHFWDRCNLQSAILKRDKFKSAFMDYISFMQYADAQTVHESIDKLIAAYAKSPQHLLTLAELAEEAVYNGEAEFFSDEIFLPFAKAAVDNKKISKTNKARLAHEVKVVEQTMTGAIIPEIRLTLADGSKMNLSDTRGAYVLLFVNDPDCDECRMARIRLSADHNINEFIDSGQLKVVSVYPGEYSQEWVQEVSNYNPRWIVAAAPDVDEELDLRFTPSIYYLTPRGKILSKTSSIEDLLEGFHRVNAKTAH